MPATVEKHAELPVVIATISGKFTLEDALMIWQKTAELRQDMPEHIFRITDIRQGKSSFEEVRCVLRAVNEVPGASRTLDPTVTVLFVGDMYWGRLFIEAMAQPSLAGVHIPVFATVEEACEHVRRLLATHSSA